MPLRLVARCESRATRPSARSEPESMPLHRHTCRPRRRAVAPPHDARPTRIRRQAPAHGAAKGPDAYGCSETLSDTAADLASH